MMPIPLNEGRGFHPGDTLSVAHIPAPVKVEARSTKAGAFTPATLRGIELERTAPDILRSTKAGAFTPATRECRALPA